MFLFIGLGNPGARYAGNRHNIGFMALDVIAQGYDFGPLAVEIRRPTRRRALWV